MPTWAKVLIVLVVAAILCGGVALYFGIRWARREVRQLHNEGPSIVAEGNEFGRRKDGNACVAEGITRLNRCDGFICETKVRIFLNSCLQTATVAPEFCKDVPRVTEIMKTASWGPAECKRRGAKDMTRCARVLGAIQEYCSR
ncbi:MAG TPA: hypothetical protein VJZ00_25245 [Thermoanaerobaculia bacterium]|nr:hypothetical protein [Thermoanaerobaculia bacterium]